MHKNDKKWHLTIIALKKIKNRPTVKVDDTTGFLQTIRLIVTIKCNAK